MIPEVDDYSDDLLYRVDAVEHAEAPEGMPGGVWHSYVIRRGKSKITGLKKGSRFDVMQHAESMTEAFNERMSRHSVSYVSRRKKK
ncbi:MAG: hypothetical protein OEZ43_15690 [Gammaproteobacteria bacterium]|nr:hypothetical protein [Gammaproteobacteria bacterium]